MSYDPGHTSLATTTLPLNAERSQENTSTLVLNIGGSSLDEQEYRNQKLLTDDSMISRGPLVFVMVLMMMVGGTVNTVVTMVFLKRFPSSAIRSYLVTLSVSDMCATLVGIPLFIFKVLNAYSFLHASVCRLIFMVVSLSTNLSSFIVLLLALDRLRRVNNPSFKETDRLRSFYNVGLAVFLSALVSVPFAPMFGITKRPSYAGTNVNICWVDKAYEGTLYPVAYNTTVGVTFFVSLGLLMYSYSTIGYKIHVLTRDIKAEITDMLENPPPPNKYMYIYEEGLRSSVSTMVKRMSHVREAGEAAGLTFAERLHQPRPEGEMTQTDPSGKKKSRMKKLSNAISNFFAVEESESKQSVNMSSFISQRGFGSFAKTVDVTSEKAKTSPLLPRAQPLEKVREDTSTGVTSSAPSSTEIGATSSPNTNVVSILPSFATNLNTNVSANDPPAILKQPGVVKSSSAQSPTSPHITTDSMVTTPKTMGDYDQVVDKGAINTSVKHKSVTKEPLKDPPQTRFSMAQDPGRLRSGTIFALQQEQLKEEALLTLYRLDHIRRSSRNTMIVIVILFILTWMPHFFSRVLTNDPPVLCKGTKEDESMSNCWTNIPSYGISSVFINSTLNAFFYCFGSVHFRKQVTMFFRPCKLMLCPKKKRRRVRVIRQVKTQATEPGAQGAPPPEGAAPGTPAEGAAPGTPAEGGPSPTSPTLEGDKPATAPDGK